MKVLLDSCVWGGAATVLQTAGHEVRWVGAEPDPGDEDLLKQATREGRVMVTLDKDYGELAVLRGMKHTGIVRIVDHPAAKQGPACVAALAKHGADLARGAIVTVEPGRTRVRPPEGE